MASKGKKKSTNGRLQARAPNAAMPGQTGAPNKDASPPPEAQLEQVMGQFQAAAPVQQAQMINQGQMPMPNSNQAQYAEMMQGMSPVEQARFITQGLQSGEFPIPNQQTSGGVIPGSDSPVGVPGIPTPPEITAPADPGQDGGIQDPGSVQDMMQLRQWQEDYPWIAGIGANFQNSPAPQSHFNRIRNDPDAIAYYEHLYGPLPETGPQGF